jgi:hypothetical protein
LILSTTAGTRAYARPGWVVSEETVRFEIGAAQHKGRMSPPNQRPSNTKISSEAPF